MGVSLASRTVPVRNQVSHCPATTISQSPDRHRLLLLHLPQVRIVAKSIWDRLRFAVELDDLVGYGTIGLLHAVERYDPGRGILLKTYAEHRIRGAILDGLRGMDWLPRSARQKDREQKEALNKQQTDAGDAASIAAKPSTRLNPLHATAARTQAAEPPRMRSVFPGGNLGDLEKLALSPQAGPPRLDSESNPESLYERKERYDRLSDAIRRLPPRHREIIALYYQRELSMKQIGMRLRVHESRISQLHAAALTRLRKELAGNGRALAADGNRPQRYS